jgi:PPOX class probable F420-dependent enzyme
MLEPADVELLEGRSFGHFVTLNEDGSPQATPVWIDVDDDGHVLVNSAAGRRKDRNARRDPRVAVSVHDQDDPYRWLSVEGRVVELREGSEADDHIDALSRRYLDRPWSPVQGQVRVIYRIRPERVTRSQD